MKKILCMLMSALLIAGCSQVEEPIDDTAQNEVKEDVNSIPEGSTVMRVTTEFEMVYNYMDAKQIYDFVDDVAVIKVDSIDGVDNYNPETGNYLVRPFVYGKATVIESIKGNLAEGSTIDYMKGGAIIPYEMYYNGATDKAKELMDQSEDHPDYVDYRHDDDIDIESGKTYLVYLIKHESINKQAIQGLGGGLREIQGNPKAKSEAKVYNNFTKEWESLADVLDVE